MSNMLRDVFSNELPDMVGKLRFKDIESSNAFVNALRNLDEGKTSDINGVDVLKTIFVSGNISYSTQVQGGEITVSPAK